MPLSAANIPLLSPGTAASAASKYAVSRAMLPSRADYARCRSCRHLVMIRAIDGHGRVAFSRCRGAPSRLACRHYFRCGECAASRDIVMRASLLFARRMHSRARFASPTRFTRRAHAEQPSPLYLSSRSPRYPSRAMMPRVITATIIEKC